MIRYHSFYPWHRERAYTYFENDEDKQALKDVLVSFQHPLSLFRLLDGSLIPPLLSTNRPSTLMISTPRATRPLSRTSSSPTTAASSPSTSPTRSTGSFHTPNLPSLLPMCLSFSLFLVNTPSVPSRPSCFSYQTSLKPYVPFHSPLLPPTFQFDTCLSDFSKNLEVFPVLALYPVIARSTSSFLSFRRPRPLRDSTAEHKSLLRRLWKTSTKVASRGERKGCVVLSAHAKSFGPPRSTATPYVPPSAKSTTANNPPALVGPRETVHRAWGVEDRCWAVLGRKGGG